MKAVQINEYGDSSVIHLNEVDKPAAGVGQVLVEVHASSLNPVDSAIRSGYMHAMAPIQFPATLGGDIAGVVADVGAGVEGLKVGDKVYGQALVIAGNSGAFAEYAATGADQVAAMPASLDFNQAASLPLTAASALQALTQHIKLQPGQRIFIHGGAGGIGTMAIQIAKDIGAYVAVTATGDGTDLVRRLGADEVIDYKAADFSTALTGFDAVLDTVGGEDLNKALAILKSGAVAVSLAGQADAALTEKLGVTFIHQFTKITPAVLENISALVEKGIIKPQIDRVCRLEQIKEAFDARETGSVRGKIVIQIK